MGGDWNADAGQVRGGGFSSFSKLIGGTPTVVAPDVATCCHQKHGPNTLQYDHAATNIAGATAGASKVFDYQLTDKFSMEEEHKPVSQHINVPPGTTNTAQRETLSVLTLV